MGEASRDETEEEADDDDVGAMMGTAAPPAESTIWNLSECAALLFCASIHLRLESRIESTDDATGACARAFVAGEDDDSLSLLLLLLLLTGVTAEGDREGDRSADGEAMLDGMAMDVGFVSVLPCLSFLSSSPRLERTSLSLRWCALSSLSAAARRAFRLARLALNASALRLLASAILAFSSVAADHAARAATAAEARLDPELLFWRASAALLTTERGLAEEAEEAEETEEEEDEARATTAAGEPEALAAGAWCRLPLSAMATACAAGGGAAVKRMLT